MRERLVSQDEDGSWDGSVVVTARNLRELADLGCTRRTGAVRKAVAWLLDRAQSAANPGMFFLTDELVATQARILAEKKRTRAAGLRFRERKKSEIQLVLPGDDLLRDPSGPRIMWPNALVLEALLALGYEKQKRVRAALGVLAHGNWCECGYQHGLASWRRREPLSLQEADDRVAETKARFRYGGAAGLQDLAKMDLTKTHGVRMWRASHTRRNGTDTYVLTVSSSLQSCAFITTRAVRKVKDARVRKVAAAELWRYAAMQKPDGTFPDQGRERLYELEAAMLQMFAGYAHPASRIATLRAVPWIIASQNSDGSWGDDPRKDAATFGVLSALARASRYVSAGFVR